jgi:hypothetical protein
VPNEDDVGKLFPDEQVGYVRDMSVEADIPVQQMRAIGKTG